VKTIGPIHFEVTEFIERS